MRTLHTIIILLSMFPDGILRLTSQYQNERAQAENNIKEQMKKMGEAEEINIKEIKQSLNKLNAAKKNADAKLLFLKPKRQILQLFIPLLTSFAGVIFAHWRKHAGEAFVLFFLLLQLSQLSFIGYLALVDLTE